MRSIARFDLLPPAAVLFGQQPGALNQFDAAAVNFSEQRRRPLGLAGVDRLPRPRVPVGLKGKWEPAAAKRPAPCRFTGGSTPAPAVRYRFDYGILGLPSIGLS
jgi:hypothetical protein